MSSFIDLHIHSTASDGTETPQNILKQALDKNLTHISLTDHESTEGYKELLTLKKKWHNKINIIPGVELHTFYKGKEVHLLGYFIDTEDTSFESELKKLRKARTEVSYYTVERLNKAGINISWEVIENNFTHDVAITKGHIMQTIRNKNIEFTKEDFSKFFYTSSPLYIPFTLNPLENAIEFIKENGGIPILAHPGLIRDDSIVKEIIDKYRIGIEVYYHYFGDNAEQWVKKYENIGREYNVLLTGGSDYHGNITKVEMADIYVPQRVIDGLMNKKYDYK